MPVINRIDRTGYLFQKVANTLRFERFWVEYVAGNPEVIVVPSFAKTRSKHPIWQIAVDHAKALGCDGTVLEFGTHNGGSLYWFWKNFPKTVKLVGFDCFEGLPERWDSAPKGAMRGFGAPVELWSDYPEVKAEVVANAAKGGGVPPPPQENVSIECGLFSQSVPRFLKNGVPRDIRLVHFDADLYMSTRPVLDSVCGEIDYRYYILFDEFYSVNHEFRAWIDFVALYDVRQWKVVAIAEDGVQILLEVN